MNGKQVANEIRAWLDFAVGWIYWLSVTALVFVFAASVARMFGFRPPFLPTLSDQAMLYAAGVAWLLKR